MLELDIPLLILDIVFSIFGGVLYSEKLVAEGIKGIKKAVAVSGAVSLILLSLKAFTNPNLNLSVELITLFMGTLLGAVSTKISAHLKEEPF